MSRDQRQEHQGKTEKSFGQTTPSLINDKHHAPASDPLQEFLCLRCDGRFMASETFPSCPVCYPATALFEAKRKAAHRLAMLALQSDRYAQDAEYREATDDVLAFSFPESNASKKITPRRRYQ